MNTFPRKFRTSFLPSLAIVIAFLICGMQGAQAQYSNITITGFNNDVVANGSGAPSTSTNNSVDAATGTASGYAFVDTTYCSIGTYKTGIWPTNLIIASTAAPGLNYILQPAAGNNDIRFPNLTTGGEGAQSYNFGVSGGPNAGTIYLLHTTGSGALSPGATITVKFGDSTSQVWNSVNFGNWCTSATTTTTAATTGSTAVTETTIASPEYYRVGLPGTACSAPGLCDYMEEMALPLLAANYFKPISYITINKTATTGVINVFAMGIEAPCVAPTAQPTALISTAISLSSIAASFTAASPVPVGGYLVVQYPHGSAVTNPVNGTTYTAGNALGLGTVVSAGASTSFTASGLSSSTTYDYYVYSYAGTVCVGGPLYDVTSPLSNSFTTNACGTMSGTIPIGPTAPASPAGFPTLTAALAYINTNGIGGSTIWELQSNYVSTAETSFPLTFSNNVCVTSSNTLLVRPAAGATGLVITNAGVTAAATVTIDLNGANYVTIDGRPGSSGTSGSGSSGTTMTNGITGALQIINTNTTAVATVRLINDARNNNIEYCNIQGSSTTYANPPTAGTVFIGGTTGVNGNDNNSITYCDIHAAGSNLPNTALAAYNSTAQGNAANNDNVTIDHNNIYDYTTPSANNASGIYIWLGDNTFTITNNSIFQTASRTINFAAVYRFMWLGADNSTAGTFASGYNVSGNYLGGTLPQCGGTALTVTSTTTLRMLGMDMNFGNGTATSISGNTMQNISFTSTSTSTGTAGMFTGMYWGYGNGNITGNTFGSASANSINIIPTASGGTSCAIGVAGGAAGYYMKVSGNTINNITAASTTSTVYNTLIGIYIQASNQGMIIGGYNTAAGNTISNLTVGSSTTTTTQAANNAQAVGIYISGALIDAAIEYNTINNIFNYYPSSSTGTSSSIIGINITSTSSNSDTINNNILYNFANKCASTSAAFSPYLWGICCSGGTSGGHVIANNLVSGLDLPNWAPSAATTGIPQIVGIGQQSGPATLYNNMVSLGVTTAGTSDALPIRYYGMYHNTAYNGSYWFNSVYIGGAMTTNTTAAFVTGAFANGNATGTLDIRDNIFANVRTSSVAYGYNYDIAAATALPASPTFNYNVYYNSAGSGNYFYDAAGTTTAYSSGWIAGDINSQYGTSANFPEFNNPSGAFSTSTPFNLDLSTSVATPAEGQGIAIAAVTTDIHGNNRGSYTPTDIGADAGNFISTLTPCSSGSFTAGTAVASGITACAATLSLSGNTAGVSGLSYQWQVRYPSGSGTWTNVGGATLPILTASLPGSITDYQCVITCSAGGTATSTLVTVYANPGVAGGFTPITGSSMGWNLSAIAHGTCSGNPLNSVMSSGVMGDVDHVGYLFYDNTYSCPTCPAAATTPAYSLPANGQIISGDQTGLLYQLEPSNQNNDLELVVGTNPTGTLTFPSAISTPALYLLVTSGSGASTMTAVVNFSDTTGTQSFTGLAVADWFSGTPFAEGGFGRVCGSASSGTIGSFSGTGCTPPGGTSTCASGTPRMYDVALPLNSVFYNKHVSSITITNTAAGSSSADILNIFAVSAAVSAPAAFCGGLPTSLTLFNPTTTGATYQWEYATTSGGPYTAISNSGTWNGTTDFGHGSTTTTFTDTVSGTIYYVCQTTCTATGATVLSNEVTENISPVPTVTVTPPTSTYCQGGTGVTLTASGTATSYSWSPSAGLSSITGATTVASPGSTTTFTVTGLINSCLATASATVNYSAAPVVTAITASPSALCAGATTTLSVTYTGTASSILWSDSVGTGTITTPTTASTTITAPSNGINIYKVVLPNGTCTTVSSVKDTVGQALAVTATNGVTPATYCTPTITDGTIYADYIRTAVLNGTTNTTTTAGYTNNTFNYVTTNTYAVTAGTAYTLTGTIESDYTDLEDGEALQAWIDYNDDGVFETGESVGIFTTTADETSTANINYSLSFTVPANAISATTRLRIMLIGEAAYYTPPYTPCGGSSYYFGQVQDYNITISGGTSANCGGTFAYTLQPVATGGGAPYTYSWSSSPSGFTSTSESPSVSPTTNTTYTVTVTDHCGNTATASTNISLITVPAVTLSTGSYSLECGNAPVAVNVTSTPLSTYATYEWSPAAGLYTNSGGTIAYTSGNSATSVYAFPTSTTSYTVTATMSGTGCTTTATTSIYNTTTPVSVVQPTSCAPDSGVISITKLSGSTPALIYQSNFASGLGIASIYGTGAPSGDEITGGQLQLNANVGSQNGWIQIPQSYSPTVIHTAFQLTTGTATTGYNAADGISYSFGTNVAPSGPAYENGFGYGLKVCFFSYIHGGSDWTQTSGNSTYGIYIQYGAPYTGQTTTGVLGYSSDISWTGTTSNVVLDVNAAGQLTLTVGSTVEFTNLQLPAAWLTDNKTSWLHTIASRTGGVAELVDINNIYITEGVTPFTPQYGLNSSSWQNSNVFRGLGAGIYSVNVRDSANPTCITTITKDTLAVTPLAVAPAYSVVSASSYCSPTWDIGPGDGDYIYGATLNGVTNTTTSGAYTANGYNYVTTNTYSVTAGTAYTLTGTISSDYNDLGGGQQMEVWIDYNNDGTFESNEEVGTFSTTADETSAANINYSISFTVPVSAINGTTRMRMVMASEFDNTLPFSACPTSSSYYFGQAMDYNVTIGGGTNPLCGGLSTFLLTAHASGGAPSYHYSWSSSPAGFTDTLATGTVSPAVPTTYTCQVTDSCGHVVSHSVSISVLPAPTVTVNDSSANYCTGGSAVSLTASGASTYSWSPATGLNTSTGATVQASPTTYTTYTVTGVAANTCYASAKSNIYVYARPVIDSITASLDPVCIGTPSQLNVVATAPVVTACIPPFGTSAGYGCSLEYIYDFSIKTSGGATVISNQGQGGCYVNGNTYNNLGTTYTSGGLVAGQTYTVNFQDLSDNYTGYTLFIDYNQDGIFEANELAFSSQSQGEDNATSYSGTFTVPLTAINGPVNVLARADWAFWPTTGCQSMNQQTGEIQNYVVSISNGVAPSLTYVWSPSTTLNFSNIINPVATVTATTDYNVTVSYPLTGCFATSNKNVVANPRPTASISGTSSVCQGVTTPYTITFTGTGPWNYTLDTAGVGISGVAATSPLVLNLMPYNSMTIKMVSLSDAHCTSIASDFHDSINVVINTSCPTTWVGTTSSNWNTASNWSPPAVPNLCSVDVVIPAGTPFSPVISSGNIQVGNLTINSPQSITLNGYNLSVCKNLLGNYGVYLPGSGNLVFDGSVPQNVTGTIHVDGVVFDNTSTPVGSNVVFTNYTVMSVYRGASLQAGNVNVTTSNAALTLLSTNVDSAAYLNDFTGGYTGTFTGNLIAHRQVAVTGTAWQHEISSPVNGATFYQMIQQGNEAYGYPLTDAYLIPSSNCSEDSISYLSPYSSAFTWNEGNVNVTTPCITTGWQTVGYNDSWTPGKGYSVYLNSGSNLYLEGQPNTGNISLGNCTNGGWSFASPPTAGNPTSHTDNSGWSMVGNPYPSGLNISATSTGFDGQVQVFHPSGTYLGTYNPVQLTTSTLHLAPYQAFMAHKTTVGGTATWTFNQSGRTTNVGTQYQFYELSEDAMTIQVKGNGFADMTRLEFNAGATDGFDVDYDADKFQSNQGQPTLYTVIPGYGPWGGINVMGPLVKNTTVPLGMQPGADGTFTLSFDPADLAGFPASVSIYLEDKQNPSNWVNVRTTNSYTFTSKASDQALRFALHFSPEGSSGISSTNANATDINIFSAANSVMVDFSRLQTVDATIQIYDVLGQQLSNEEYHTADIYSKAITSVEAAYVIVMVRMDDGQITSKKLFLTK